MENDYTIDDLIEEVEVIEGEKDFPTNRIDLMSTRQFIAYVEMELANIQQKAKR
jgi:hypothetical protein